MLQFILDHLATLLVGLAVAALLALSLCAMRRDKRSMRTKAAAAAGAAVAPMRASAMGNKYPEICK